MKILVAGNLANHGYFLTKLLREKGVDAELLTKKNSVSTEDPKFFDELDEYPDWIKFWDGSKSDWKYKIIKIMKNYDIIQASTELPMFAMMSRKPYVAFTTGADVVKLANEKSLKGLMLKRAYHHAKAVVYPAPYLHKYVDKLKIKKNIFVPLLWDYTKFNPKNEKTTTDFVIFHPTNHVWDYKKNDRFLKAYIKLVKSKKNVKLIIIKRGPDFEKSLDLLSDQEVKEKVTILPDTIPQAEIVKHYNSSDVIADQFGVGSTGLIGQEVMSCGKPLLQYVDNDVYEKFYSEAPPILNAQYEEEIYEQLSSLIDNPKLGLEVGEKSRNWILNHHNHDKVIEKYIYLYNSIHNKIDFKEIKSTVLSME